MPNCMMRSCCLAFLLALVLLTSLAVSANQRKSKGRNAPQLYASLCVACHGADGRARTSKGKFSHARDLTDAKWQEDVTDERLFNSIMNGRNVRGNMPAFSDKLNEKEVDSLVSFVRKFKG